MNLKHIKHLIKKGAQWSGEKQMKVFLKNKTTTSFFKEAMSSSVK